MYILSAMVSFSKQPSAVLQENSEQGESTYLRSSVTSLAFRPSCRHFQMNATPRGVHHHHMFTQASRQLAD